MLLIDEVKSKLASTAKNNIRRIDLLPESAEGYVVRDSFWYGVGVPYDGKLVNESFANARIRSATFHINGATLKLLLLECSLESVRSQFAAVCAEFLTPGIDNHERHMLLADPIGWWRKWRELLGNAIHDKSAYQLLGEMLTLEYLIRNGTDAVWQGATGTTKDIDTPSCSYEVKSTLSRYATQVVISSKFQLVANGKPLKLAFARFEPSANGISLAKAVDRLCALGCSKELLLRMLARQGVVPGNIAYSTGYNLLELRLYDVDDRFPLISDASFIGGHIPESVVDFTYTVDLVGLPYTSV